MARRLSPWKPWHAAPTPADNAVVLAPEEIAQIEAAREERDKETRRRSNAAFKARLKAKRAAEREED
jgi:hypothetical protein